MFELHQLDRMIIVHKGVRDSYKSAIPPLQDNIHRLTYRLRSISNDDVRQQLTTEKVRINALLANKWYDLSRIEGAIKDWEAEKAEVLAGLGIGTGGFLV